MGQTGFFVNFFVALFALIDPIGNVPLFAAATLGASPAGRRWVAAYIAGFAFLFMGFFWFTGVSLLQFFGISLPAFRIAGGVILFMLGLNMTRDDFTAAFADAAEAAEPEAPRAYARKRFERLVVPFAMPLLIGPGAISTAVIYAGEAHHWGLAGMAIGLGAIGAVCVVTMLCFWVSPLISRLLGKIGMTIVVRVLGLILCALAVQFVIAGMAEVTHGMVRPSVATPYQ